MPASLTERQRAYLKYIQEYVYKNEDTPRLEEIADHFQVRSSTAHKILKALLNKGYLIFDRTSEAGFFIRLIETAGNSEKIVETPIVGEINRYGEIEIYGLLKHIAKNTDIEDIKDIESVDDIKKTGRIPILTYSDNPLDIVAYVVTEDIPSVSMQFDDIIVVDNERQPQAGDICLFSHNDGFILMRVVSKTFDKDTPWPEMAQEYPIPEAFSHPDYEQELFWYPMALDDETEEYFLNLMEMERWGWISSTTLVGFGDCNSTNTSLALRGNTRIENSRLTQLITSWTSSSRISSVDTILRIEQEETLEEGVFDSQEDK